MPSVYEVANGDEGLLRLAEAWHARVMADEVVSHAFSHGYHPQHSERLATYWAEALGGPHTYSERYGDETAVVRIHSGNGPHQEMDERAVACFDQALEDVGLTNEPLRQVLHDYFAWATTTTMSAYHDSADDVPQDLSIPRWSWDGLQHYPPSVLGATPMLRLTVHAPELLHRVPVESTTIGCHRSHHSSDRAATRFCAAQGALRPIHR